MTVRCLNYSLEGWINYKSPIFCDEVYMLVEAGTPDAFDWLDEE